MTKIYDCSLACQCASQVRNTSLQLTTLRTTLSWNSRSCQGWRHLHGSTSWQHHQHERVGLGARSPRTQLRPGISTAAGLHAERPRSHAASLFDLIARLRVSCCRKGRQLLRCWRQMHSCRPRLQQQQQQQKQPAHHRREKRFNCIAANLR